MHLIVVGGCGEEFLSFCGVLALGRMAANGDDASGRRQSQPLRLKMRYITATMTPINESTRG